MSIQFGKEPYPRCLGFFISSALLFAALGSQARAHHPEYTEYEPPPAKVQVTEGLEIKEGPYLQNVDLTGVTVMWETTERANSTVYYFYEGAWQSVTDSESVKIHEVRLLGFAPSDTVTYFVRSETESESIDSEMASLQVAPPWGSGFRMAVWSDNQANPDIFTQIVQGNGIGGGMISEAPDLLVGGGDLVDIGSDYSRWGDELLTPLKPLAQDVPFFSAIGNHEGDSHWFYDYLDQPGNEHYFSVDYGRAHPLY